MDTNLPANLFDAECQIYESITAFCSKSGSGRISVNLNFEGLKLLPISYRLIKKLQRSNPNSYFIWPDPGAAALAKREYPELSTQILSFKEFSAKQFQNTETSIALAVRPKHFD